ncbi:MAG: universal stress protein [Thermoanaerobaculia bacterium]
MRTRRILVAMDGSPGSRAALEAAARLGLTAGAELSGLFIEDVELIRLAGLPFAREAGVSSGMFRRLEAVDVERQFHVAAEAARELLREAFWSMALPSTFRVVRGRVVPEILAASRDADVVAVGKRSGHGVTGRRLGATTRGLIAHLSAPVLVGGLRSLTAGPAVVICTTRDISEEALGFVMLLVRAFGAPEVVVIAGEGARGPSRPERDGVTIRRRDFPSISSGGVKALPEIAGASAVVLVRPEGVAGNELLVALAEAVTCPVFVIGESGMAELLSA